MRLAEAERYANEVAAMLQPACERIIVCGSIRRRKPEVKDIEIVALPKRGRSRPTFGEPGTALPPRMRQEGGHPRRFVAPGTDREAVPCWVEDDFFAALGLPTPPPEDRSIATVARLRAARPAEVGA